MLTHLPVTLTATQENMDLFTLTLAWLEHTVTVLGHNTGQPHSFKTTGDRITNTHTSVGSHKPYIHTHTPSHTSHAHTHTHTPAQAS